MPEQREAYEEILGRLNRRLRALYRCTSAFFQAESEQELLQSICDILVAGGEGRLAWIGYCEDDAEKTVRPGAQAGYRPHFLEGIKNSLGGVGKWQGPAGLSAPAR